MTGSQNSQDHPGGEFKQSGGDPIPRDDTMLSGPEFCHRPKLRLVTLWPNRRRPPSVVFLKMYLEELKKQASMATAPSRFELVAVRDHKGLDDVVGEGAVNEQPIPSHGSPADPLGAPSTGLGKISFPIAPDERVMEAQKKVVEYREVSKYARIRGLPTPRSSSVKVAEELRTKGV